MIHYIDCGPDFINAANHSLNATLLPEYLHPSTAGYRVLADCLKPVVDNLVLGMVASLCRQLSLPLLCCYALRSGTAAKAGQNHNRCCIHLIVKPGVYESECGPCAGC